KTTQFAGVTDGTFDVNGVTIAVDAQQDSLADVIARINAANAGVSAAYDPLADRVTLASTVDSEDLIAVGSDSSGFLAAAGLDAANTVRGNLPDDQQVLAKTSQFGAVTSGAFTIGGVSIDVDVDTDTLRNVIDRINQANAGVTAAYDSGLDRIVLTGTTASEDLIAVGNDTTGLLAASGLSSANTVRGNVPDDQQVLAKTSQFQSVVTGTFQVN